MWRSLAPQSQDNFLLLLEEELTSSPTSSSCDMNVLSLKSISTEEGSRSQCGRAKPKMKGTLRDATSGRTREPAGAELHSIPGHKTTRMLPRATERGKKGFLYDTDEGNKRRARAG